MGSLFSKPKLTSTSSLSGPQERLLDPLSQFIQAQLGAPTPRLDQLGAQLFRDNTRQSRQLSERMFSEALLRPALRSFDQEIAPRIDAGFASIGGTLSSRRGQARADALSDLHSNATAQLAGILPQIQAFPLQQTLSQIQGFGSLEALRYMPFHEALNFALTPTRQAGQQPAGPGWGLLGQALGAGSFIAGASLGGGK